MNPKNATIRMSTYLFSLSITIIIGFIVVYLFTKSKTNKQVQDEEEKEQFESLVYYFKTHREFISLKKNDNNTNTIRVMSYNILAPDPCGIDKDQYAMSEKHNYCPRKYRLWTYRLPRIMAQVAAYKPDFVCLQETTSHSFRNYLLKEFHSLGFEGWHEKRSLSIVKATEAVFWNKNKFECLRKKVIRFNQVCDAFDNAKYLGIKDENNEFYNMLKNRGDMIMVLYLRNVLNGKEFILCSSHLFYDPKWSDIKLIQCLLLNKSLYALIVSEWKLNVNDIGIIFGVDANSYSIKTKADIFDKNIKGNKGMRSGVYQLMTQGIVSKKHNDHPSKRVFLRNDENENKLKQQIRFVQHINDYNYNEYGRMLWKSAYNINGKEPIYSTKTDAFRATIDYIFYSGNVEKIGYLEMPFQNKLHQKELNVSSDIECSQKFDHFPNKHYPSDHIALVADFKLL